MNAAACEYPVRADVLCGASPGCPDGDGTAGAPHPQWRVQRRPGLTGVAQTSGRDKVTAHEKAKMDAFYANNASMQLDCRVLMLTIGYVLRSQDICEGAPSGQQTDSPRRERSA